ncbi:MAG: DUF4347 domain-containing protein [Simplicispira sp.]|uniref:DUF4347 domain-containing protein n=1 Tax=Simplicispira sp. TaxID=2015802 RepID=UPI00258DCB31|nr:DUF4347 domain-containing protein [Simplicispira sp.]MDD2691365.1 DUF4347 domain-containing protein [Simplicispira sp.]
MTPSATPLSPARKEIAFVDTAVADWQTLVAGIRPGIEVVLLDSNRDGLAQIVQWAEGKSGYDAIHVLSHGNVGSVTLGTLNLDHSAVMSRSGDLASLGGALTAGGDLLLYGCQVADGTTDTFLAALADTTGADVAASDDLTGASRLGGDWTLEHRTGAIQAPLIQIPAYTHVLASTVFSFDSGSITGENTRTYTIKDTTSNYSLRFVTTDTSTDPYAKFHTYNDSNTFLVTPYDGKYLYLSNTLAGAAVTITADINNDGDFGDAFKLVSFKFSDPSMMGGTNTITPNNIAANKEDVVVDSRPENIVDYTPTVAANFGSLTSLTITFDPQVQGIMLDDFKVEPSAPATPTVTGVTSSTTNGSYNAGDVISIQVTFSESVTVDTTGGTPQLTLETGTTDRTATYVSGSPGTTLTFEYTVQAGDTAADLDYTASSALAFNGSSINATTGGAAATLTLPAPDAANSLGANKAIIIDTTAPAAPSTPDMAQASDSGSSNTDNLTNDTTPTFSGTAEVGSTVTLYDTDGSTSLGSATATGGNWSITASTLSAGEHTVTAKATDAAGNVSDASNGLSITIDTTAPAAPSSPDMAAGTDSGTSNSDNTTSDTTPTFTGTAEANATVTLISSVNGTVGTATADGSGHWSITASALNSGAHTITATSTDTAGNVSSTYSGLSVTIDATAPTIIFSALSFSADTGSSSTDFNTKTTEQTIDATLSTGIDVGDIVYGSLDNGSTWSNITSKVSGTTLSWDGVTLASSNTLKLKVTDSAGNNGTAASQAYVLDTTAPSITVVSIPNAPIKVGDSVTATITVADDGGTTYTLGSSTIGGFTLSNLTRSNSTTYTADFTVTEGGADVAADSDIPVSLVLTDLAGNSNTAYTTAISQGGDAINAHSPTDIALSNTSVATIAGANAVVGALTSSDATSGETFTYSLVAGAGDTNNGLFNINGGNLRVNDASTLTAGNSYSVRVRTTDAAGNTFDEAFTVNAVVGPAIASATYDASTGVLAVTGSLMEANAGGADIAVSKLTLTGEGGATYTLTSPDVEITSATEFSVTLDATDKAALNTILNKNGSTSTSGTTFNLAVADDWNTQVTTGNTADASNAVTVSGVPAPSITSATYDYASNVLTVTGSGFLSKSGAVNDIDLTKLTFTGEGGVTYTLSNATGVEITSGTSFTTTLSGADLINVEALLNQDGSASAGTTTYNLATAASWNRGDATGGSDTTNGITVSNYAAPTVTSATFDASTNILTVTGTNLVSKSGASNDVAVSLLSLAGEGGSYTLTSSDVEITDTTSFAVTLNAADQLVVRGLLHKNGTASSGATTYNLAAAEDWMAGSHAATVVADLTGNGVTVSNVPTPTITSAAYDSDSGVLTVTGSNLFKKVGANNDIDLTRLTFTGQGGAGAAYTLTSASGVEITSDTAFTTTLTGTDKTNVDALLNQLGTSSIDSTPYNLAAVEDWLAGADAASVIADATNPITVAVAPKITSATYDASTGTLMVTGSNLQAQAGSSNDITANKLTFTGEGGATYTLTDTANVELTSATSFTLTLSATDRAAINQIANKNGTASTGATTYNLAADDDWNAQVTAGNTADTTGNGITVSSVAVPTLTSATFNAATGTLVVTGTGFLQRAAVNDIDVTKLTITGEGGETRTLTSTGVEITSGTSFSVTLNPADLAAANLFINKTGTSSTGGTVYNLAAAEDWAAGADAAVVVADLTGNGVTASNVAVPTITSATYNAVTGVLALTGTGFLKLSGAANDIIANKLTITGEGGAALSYTLTDTVNIDITSATAATLTLSATDKAAVNLRIDKAGTSSTGGTTYNLAADEDWAAGADAAVVVADLTGNGITATLNQAPVITSNGGGATAAVSVAENTTAVTTVTATDADGDTLSYSIVAPATLLRSPSPGALLVGDDAGKFSIDAAGRLVFNPAPDFENPQDQSDTVGNNTYVVTVKVSDNKGGSDLQTITVTVTDVAEGGGEEPPPPPKDDADGVSGEVEAQVPGLPGPGGVIVPGDGNGDGVADSEQPAVSSVPFLVTTTAQTNPGNAPPVYVTLVASSQDGKAPTGSTAALRDVRQLDAPADKPADVQMPLGLLSFKADVPTNGATESFSLYVDATLAINGYWKQNAQGSWVNLASAAYGGQLVREGDKWRLDFELQDGGEFDSDGTADGVISDPGAPGYRTSTPGVANTTPAITSGATASVAENAAINTVVYQTIATDPDAGQKLTYSLSGTDAALLAIDSSTGAVTLKASADYETKNSYSFNVTATDDGVGSLNATQAVTLSVTDVNEAPTAVTLTGTTTSLAENTHIASRREVATVRVTDDALGSNAVTLSGRDAGKFEIAGGKLYLKAGTVLDFETQSSYAVTVSATDSTVAGSSPVSTSFTLRVTNINEDGDSDNDQFPDALEAAHGLSVGTKDNDVFGSTKFYAMQLYRDTLFREAEGEGLAYWQEVLDSGAQSRVEVAQAFLNSPEFQAQAGALARLYFAAFDRIPDEAGMTHWMEQLHSQGQTLEQVAQGFADSSEFQAQYGALDNTGFLKTLYQNVLGRAPDEAGLAYWLGQLSGGTTRGEVLAGFAQSGEYKVQMQEEVAVTLLYVGLLGRSPEQGGYEHWLDQITSQGDALGAMEVFIQSDEYHDRFLPTQRQPQPLEHSLEETPVQLVGVDSMIA